LPSYQITPSLFAIVINLNFPNVKILKGENITYKLTLLEKSFYFYNVKK